MLDQVLERLTALEAVLAERDSQLAERDQQLAERDQQLAERDRQLAEGNERIAALERRVAEFERLLGRNSSNSGLPPSSDAPAVRLERRERAVTRGKGSGKKRGAQLGHKGHKRQLFAPEDVTEVVTCAPTSCGGCGEDLDASHDVAVQRDQVVELPPVRPLITEYQLHCRKCAACGLATTGKRPAGAPPGGYGPRLTTFAAMLTGAYHLSRRRAAALLRDAFGIRMSTGALSKCEHRVSEALADSYEEARQHVQEAETRHIDASTWYTNANRSAVWVVATTLVTLFAMTASASRAALMSIVGRITGRVVVDRATVFNCWTGDKRQTCWAHLLRYFEGMAQQRDGPASQVGLTLCNLTFAMFSIWHEVKKGTMTRGQFQAAMHEPHGEQEPKAFTERFRDVLRYGEICGHPATEGTCRNILENHWDALWVFVDVDLVEPTNNHAEQEVRSTVKWRQTSFGAQSERGNRFAERIMTVSRTLRKRHAPLHEFLHDVVDATWAGRTRPALVPESA